MGYSLGGRPSDAEKRRAQQGLLWIGVACVLAGALWLVLS